MSNYSQRIEDILKKNGYIVKESNNTKGVYQLFKYESILSFLKRLLELNFNPKRLKTPAGIISIVGGKTPYLFVFSTNPETREEITQIIKKAGIDGCIKTLPTYQ